MIKKKAIVTNLALRFYVKDGWTKSELDSLCESGEVYIPFPNDNSQYFVLRNHSKFNLKKLSETVILIRTFQEQYDQTDVELLSEYTEFPHSENL